MGNYTPKSPLRSTTYPYSRGVIAVHGGAGTITRANLTSRGERLYRAALERAVAAGRAVLEAGGAALDAVTSAVVVMEDDPLFNAGRGAVYNEAGRHELD